MSRRASDGYATEEETDTQLTIEQIHSFEKPETQLMGTDKSRRTPMTCRISLLFEEYEV